MKKTKLPKPVKAINYKSDKKIARAIETVATALALAIFEDKFYKEAMKLIIKDMEAKWRREDKRHAKR